MGGATSYLVESYETGEPNSVGYQWYRLYSDGWLEHGGIAKVSSADSTTITFLHPYSTVPMALATTTRTSDSFSSSVYVWNVIVAIRAISTTTLTLDDHNTNTSYPYDDVPASWVAYGWYKE